MPEARPLSALELFWKRAEKLHSAIRRNRAANVNSEQLRAQSRELVQTYFRSVRFELARARVDDREFAELDSAVKYFLKLASGKNSKNTYLKTLRTIRGLRSNMEAAVEITIGSSSSHAGPIFAPSRLETEILRTLEKMVPSAALSYRQVLQDLESPGRASYRGTAAEIRETLRETLDHFATDQEVMAASGYKNEEGRTGPTMRQKARFILKSRKQTGPQLKTSQDALDVVEAGIAALTRSLYDRGSVATHVAATRGEMATVKNFSDAVLAELLQVHPYPKE